MKPQGEKSALMPVAEALALILQHAEPRPKHALRKSVPINAALGCLLASDIQAPIHVPPEDNSAMDGYALRLGDINPSPDQPIPLPVGLRIAAGQAAAALPAGTCARIFTGAPVPLGADAVVMQEQCEVSAAGVIFPPAVPEGNNIRRAGSDIQKGQTVLTRGHRLQAQDLGLLASLGIAEVNVCAPLRVAVMATGDELMEPGQTLLPGKIYNSNQSLLQGLLQTLGAEVIALPVLPDCADATRAGLQHAASISDLVLTTGGVSVGEEDHVKASVQQLGTLALWKLALKPGKPLAFGNVAGTPFFGLPGNPVAVFVTFLLFVRPFIKTLQGSAQVTPLSVPARANFSRKTSQIRAEYLRVRLQNDGSIAAFPDQNSGVLSSTSWANALACIPPHTAVNPGDTLQTLLFSELLT